MKRLLSQVTSGNCVLMLMNAARDWLIRNSQERSSAGRRRKGSLRLTSAGKQGIELWSGLHDAISSLAVVTLHYSTLRPTQVACPRVLLLDSHSRSLLAPGLLRKLGRQVPKEDSHASGETLLGLINKTTTTTRHLRVTQKSLAPRRGGSCE